MPDTRIWQCWLLRGLPAAGPPALLAWPCTSHLSGRSVEMHLDSRIRLPLQAEKALAAMIALDDDSTLTQVLLAPLCGGRLHGSARAPPPSPRRRRPAACPA